MKKIIIFLLMAIMVLTGCNVGDDNGQQGSPGLDEGIDISMGDYNVVYKVYVSEFGVSEGDGSLGNPFKTLAEAISYVEALQEDVSVKTEYDSIEIILLEGVHETDTINITPATTKILPLSIKGEDGKKVVLSAGEKIDGSFALYKDNIYKVNVGTKIFREIYVNGNRAIRARYPNADSDVGEHGIPINFGNNAATTLSYFIDTDFLETVDMNGVELNMWRKWVNDIIMVKSFSTDGNKTIFDFKDNNQKQLFFDYPYPSKADGGTKGWLENSLSFVDQGGEWYHDRTTGDLYYKLREGETIQNIEIVLPRNNTIFSIKGVSDEVKVNNLAITNMELAYTNFDAPSNNDGMVDTQSIGYLTYYNKISKLQKVNRVPGAIEIDYGKNIFIEDNTIKNLASSAISIGQGNETIVVQRNKFESIGKNAVEVGFFNEDNIRISMIGGMFGNNTDKYLTKNVIVQYNYFHNIGNNYVGSAVLTGYANTLKIIHNEIDTVSYSGMALGWGWTRNIEISGSIIVQRNIIKNALNNYLDDGAAIYCLGKTANDMVNIIENNYIESNNNRATGLYFDQGVTNYFANNNVLIGQFFRGTVYLHDREKALRNINVTNTYSTDMCIYHSHSPFLEEITERNISYEDIIILFEDQKDNWPEEVEKIKNNAGLPEKYKYLKK